MTSFDSYDNDANIVAFPQIAFDYDEKKIKKKKTESKKILTFSNRPIWHLPTINTRSMKFALA